ncbi:Protein T16G12.1 [Aphelenchoides avenae]|nr:Protein T16G12.1 [Aphelenchus avenae]
MSVLALLLTTLFPCVLGIPVEQNWPRGLRRSGSLQGDGPSLPRNVEVQRYNIILKPYFPADGVSYNPAKKFTFDGNVSIGFRMLEEAKSIALHQANITVNKLFLLSDGVAIDVQSSLDENQRVVLTPAENFRPDTQYVVLIEYEGEINTVGKLHGVYAQNYTDAKLQDKYLVVTHLETSNARAVFPCFDEPSFKAVFQLTLIYPKGLTALSNTPEPEPQSLDDIYQVSTFPATPRMSAYLLAFAIGDFVSATAKNTRDGLTVRAWGWSEMKDYLQHSADAIANCTAAMEKFTGIDYVLPKLDVIAVPDFRGAAMENWGLIVADRTLVYIDPSLSSTDDVLSSHRVLCHETVHQWFGNLITTDTWGDVFLQESFAELLGTHMPNEYIPEKSRQSMLDAFTYTDMERGFGGLSRQPHPLATNVADFGYCYYVGAPILRTFMIAAGKKAFQSGIQHFLKDHSFKNANHAQLIDALVKVRTLSKFTDHIVQGYEEAHVEGPCSGKVNFTQFYDAWIQQPSVPRINVTTVNGKTTVLQQPFSADKGQTWDVPLVVTDLGSRQREFAWLLASGEVCAEDSVLGQCECVTEVVQDRTKVYNPSSMTMSRVYYDKEALTQVLDAVVQSPEKVDNQLLLRLLLDSAAQGADDVKQVMHAVQQIWSQLIQADTVSSFLIRAVLENNDQEEAMQQLLQDAYHEYEWKQYGLDEWDAR